MRKCKTGFRRSKFAGDAYIVFFLSDLDCLFLDQIDSLNMILCQLAGVCDLAICFGDVAEAQERKKNDKKAFALRKRSSTENYFSWILTEAANMV
jgi:hypothetical protein